MNRLAAAIFSPSAVSRRKKPACVRRDPVDIDQLQSCSARRNLHANLPGF